MEIKFFQTIELNEEEVAQAMIDTFTDYIYDNLPLDVGLDDVDMEFYNKFFDNVMKELQKFRKEEREEN